MNAENSYCSNRRHQVLATEQDLIESVLKGSAEAQEEFVARYARLINAILRSQGLAGQEREDRFQQVFLHLWEHDCRRLRLWNSERGRFTSFLTTVIIRLVRDLARQSPGRSQIEHPVSWDSAIETSKPGWTVLHPDFDRMLLLRQQRESIANALRRLSARDAELIQRRYFRSQSYKEIAVGLRITVNNVGVALARAEKRLCNELRQGYPELYAEG